MLSYFCFQKCFLWFSLFVSTQVYCDDLSLNKRIVPQDSHSLLRKPSKLAPRSKPSKFSKFTSSARVIAIRAFGGGRSGAIAGIVQVASMMWLRTIMNYQYRYGLTAQDTARTLWTQGGIFRFYRGISFALLQGPLARFGATASNEAMLGIISKMEVHSNLKMTLVSALSSVAAGLWRIFIMPLDTCKTVLQVEGNNGFHVIVSKVRLGQIRFLYSGAYASALATALGHLPWFSTFNFLNHYLAEQSSLFRQLMRSAFIGFSASLVSDLCTNWLRVLKTTMQVGASGRAVGYKEAASQLLREGNIKDIALRGLDTRIIANGIQSIIFTDLVVPYKLQSGDDCGQFIFILEPLDSISDY